MSTSATLVKQVESPKIRILWLGYTRNQTTLVDELVQAQCEVWHTEEKIQTTVGYDLVVSYGYRHILKKEVIESSNAPIINLHISYLPWNRGAHPNFWSFYDCTPSGVTIHLIDEGVDTGAIIYQKYVNFNKEENTYSKTYKRLISEIENLFRNHLNQIISKKFTAVPQRRKGTYHSVANLPKEFGGWESEIGIEVVRLDGILNQN
jgi:methionyl-tRNA formyltransferase